MSRLQPQLGVWVGTPPEAAAWRSARRCALRAWMANARDMLHLRAQASGLGVTSARGSSRCPLLVDAIGPTLSSASPSHRREARGEYNAGDDLRSTHAQHGSLFLLGRGAARTGCGSRSICGPGESGLNPGREVRLGAPANRLAGVTDGARVEPPCFNRPVAALGGIGSPVVAGPPAGQLP